MNCLSDLTPQRVEPFMLLFLLDAPIWLLLALSLAGLVMGYRGVSRTNPQERTIGVALLAAALLLFTLRLTVETDQKRVDKQVRALIAQISKKDWDAAGPALAHARLLEWEGNDLIQRGKDLSERYGVTDVSLNSIETRQEPNVITVTVSVTSHHKNLYVEAVPSTWVLEYQKRPQGWTLIKLTPVKIGFQDNTNAEAIIRGH
jgi:hypothetical protein